MAQLTKMALPPEIANHLIENQISEVEIPLGVALNVVVNDREVVVPMATEEPSVIAACSYGAKIAGAFQVTAIDRLMAGQIVFSKVTDQDQLIQELTNREAEFFASAAKSYPSIIKRGGGLRKISYRKVGATFVSLDILVDVKDAMGANIVNTLLEGMANQIKTWTQEEILFSILSNYATDSLVTVSCRIPVHRLSKTGAGRAVAEKIVLATTYANLDPKRAATHNKGIMNGIESVILATGNDTRAVSAACHAYASQTGQYQSLTSWKLEGDELIGSITVPLAIATVGGATKVLPKAQIALEILQVHSAKELMAIVASVGLAQNLAALRALVSEGIQAGHMSLQARALAMSVGATGNEINEVAKALQQMQMNQATARQLLAKIRR